MSQVRASCEHEAAIAPATATAASDRLALSLDELGILYGTDKSSKKHNYLSFYEQFLASSRQKEIRLLEIGVQHGNSLRTWRDFFPSGQIVGIDRDPRCLAHAGERIQVHIGDQDYPDELANLTRKFGPFDVIIDDGSHLWRHQITTLRALLPLVKPGGIFICEDLITSYGRYIPQYSEGAKESAGSYCLRFAERVLGERMIRSNPEPDAFLASAHRLVSSVHFMGRTAVFQRKAGDTSSQLA